VRLTALRYGKIYGLAVDNETIATLVETVDPTTKMLDAYLTNASAPKTFAGKFVPTSYQWGGWDQTVAVQDTEMMLWEVEEQQPAGHTFFNGDSKTEHPAADPDINNSRYVQNMTQEGALLAFDLGDLGAALSAANGELPATLDVSVNRIVAAVDGVSANTFSPSMPIWSWSSQTRAIFLACRAANTARAIRRVSRLWVARSLKRARQSSPGLGH